MVPDEPPSFVDGGEGITRLAVVSSPDYTIHVCQPGNKLCATYPAGSIHCTGDSRINFGVVGYKTALNPPPPTPPGHTGPNLASEMYAIEITTPGCTVVKPYSFTVQRNSYVDPRNGAQCRCCPYLDTACPRPYRHHSHNVPAT